MRVMVALEDRFFKTADGNIYSNTISDYKFWSRYLQCFDEVVVLARVCEINKYDTNKLPANGKGVHFINLPYYVGMKQYLKAYFKLNRTIRESLDQADAYILRIPGKIGTLLANHLRFCNRPYAVEVIGSSRDSLMNSGANPIIRPLLSFLSNREQRILCQNAIASAYVSQQYLQKQYPPGCWSTFYSTIDLQDSDILTDCELDNRLTKLKEAYCRSRPFRICHIGTMDALYKAQDALIKAVAICVENGFNIELILIGGGRHSSRFVEIANKFGVAGRTKFLGSLPPGKRIREQLDNADLFVLPSRTEGLPRALIEAMARGLPCIATDVGAIPELLSQTDIVPVANSERLALRIQTALQDFEQLKGMAKRNLRKAKDYSADILNARRIEFYNKVISETQSWFAAEEKR